MRNPLTTNWKCKIGWHKWKIISDPHCGSPAAEIFYVLTTLFIPRKRKCIRCGKEK